MGEGKFTRLYVLQVEDKNGKMHKFMENTISFTVNRNINGSPNDGQITIKNLSDEVRNLLLKDRMDTKSYRKCVLSTGYKGKPLNVILTGDIFYCYTARNGVDIDTKIHVIDGQNVMRNGCVQQCFAKETSRELVVEAYVKEAEKYGVLRGQIDAIGSAIPNALSNDNYFKDFKIDGYHVFIDNNKLNIIKKNSSLKTEALLVDNERGLLVIPARYDSFIEVKMVMESSVALCQPVKVKAETDAYFNGDYVVQEIKHSGVISFMGGSGECVTTLELQKLVINDQNKKP
jgi:hypothetical protein